MGKTFVFLIQQLVLAAVFYVILVSSNRFNIGNTERKDVEINIENGNVTTNKITLNPGNDPIEVYYGKKVTWSINLTASNVDSFWIERKAGSTKIFDFFDEPPSKPTKKGGGRVDYFRRKAEYSYTIHWKEKQGPWRKDDPKIAIRPTKNFAEKFIYIAYGLAALILSLWFFSNRNKI